MNTDYRPSEPDSSHGSLNAMRKVWVYLTARMGVTVQVLTVVVGLAAVPAERLGLIPESAQFPIIVTLLALLAVSGLIERATKIDKISSRVEDIQAEVIGDGLVNRFMQLETEAKTTAQHFKDSGILWSFATLGQAGLSDRLRTARSIRIMTTWTGILNEHESTLVEAAKNGCKIRVLMLKHDSRYAKLRSSELRFDENEGAHRIVGEFKTFQNMIRSDERVRQNLTVKAYDASPVAYLIAYDEFRLLGSFWRNRMAVSTPLLLLSGRVPAQEESDHRPDLVRLVDEHFESVWNDSGTEYVKLVDGQPTYTSAVEDSWG